MPVNLPRISSFLRYVLLALTLVLVPPAAALITATLAMEELARTGSETVLAAARTADLSRALVDQVTAMERLARQRQVLGDEGLRELYDARRAEFVGIAGRLAALDPPPPVDSRLAKLVDEERQVHEVLANFPADSPAYAVAVERFADLSAQAKGILTDSNAAITVAATDLQVDAQALKGRLLTEAAWAVPLVLILLGLAVAVIVWPLRAVDDAIRLLGSGDLDREIAIRGPNDVRELGDRLEWLRQRLLAAETDRVRLFRHVSHELKTPLASIREGAKLLEDGVLGPLTADQREIARIIVGNASELHRRIEDLLRASGLRSEGAKLDLRRTDFAEVVRSVLEQNSVPARARSVRLEASLAAITIVADPQKLRTVVDNLVTNAVKFSPVGGTVTVALRVRPEGGAELVVEDEGPGIPPIERERVFEPFYRGGANWIGNVPGTGLGLAIAREYVRAHGGDVQITDGGKGARVVAHLPVRPEGVARPSLPPQQPEVAS